MEPIKVIYLWKTEYTQPRQVDHIDGRITIVQDRLWTDGKQNFPLHEAPIGSCWNADWYVTHNIYKPGPDGRCLIVRCPNGEGSHWDWAIDSRASNCTMPDEDTHFCWVRHGRPEDGTLHVDKAGNTCAAGAGSIQTPHWHGFLQNGYLRE